MKPVRTSTGEPASPCERVMSARGGTGDAIACLEHLLAHEQSTREFELALPLRIVAHEPAAEEDQGEPDGARDQTHGQPHLPHMILVLVVLVLVVVVVLRPPHGDLDVRRVVERRELEGRVARRDIVVHEDGRRPTRGHGRGVAGAVAPVIALLVDVVVVRLGVTVLVDEAHRDVHFNP